MAVTALIQRMSALGQSATMELPDGKWCHTPEYVKMRYSGKAAVRSSVGTNSPIPIVKKVNSTVVRLTKRLQQELTPTERALLIARLEAE